MMVTVLMVTGIFFLSQLNHVLQRLVAMLPDETLRLETKFFGGVNLGLLRGILCLIVLYLAMGSITYLPISLVRALKVLETARFVLVILLVLLPVAMTMTLIWKIKEVIFG